MKIPQSPPSIKETAEILGSMNFNMETLMPHLEIVNREYLHWDELRVDDRFKEVNLKQLWALARFSRDLNRRLIKLNGTLLQYVQTPYIEKTLHDLDVRVGGKVYLDERLQNQNMQKKYLVNSLMEEAIASSQLEGAVTSRTVAKRMLRENRKPRNHSEQMIVNNYMTMRHIKEHAEPNQKLTIELMQEIHKLISKDTLEDKAHEGVFRATDDVKVFSHDGEIVHDPPGWKNIDALLKEVCDFSNNEPDKYYLNPIVKAIVLHYLMGYIHPFYDGNGRTARALFYWYLITRSYNYVEYVAVSTAIKNAPSKYARAYLYSETDGSDVTYFVKFNLRAIDIAVSSFEKYMEKTGQENVKILETIRQNPKLNFRQADILVNLNKTGKAVTISEMQERYSVTYQTARADLLGLTKQKYLQKFSKGKEFIFMLNRDKCIGGANKAHK